jgi:hypothetical protein
MRETGAVELMGVLTRRIGERGISRRDFGPKGHESLAQGLPWVSGLSPEALKGHPLTRHPGASSRNPGAPSGLVTLECVSQGKPWAKLSWPVGPKTRLRTLELSSK